MREVERQGCCWGKGPAEKMKLCKIDVLDSTGAYNASNAYTAYNVYNVVLCLYLHIVHTAHTAVQSTLCAVVAFDTFVEMRNVTRHREP